MNRLDLRSESGFTLVERIGAIPGATQLELSCWVIRCIASRPSCVASTRSP